MNVEKKFIEKIQKRYACGVEIIYDLMASDAINTQQMKKYLVRAKYNEIVGKGGKIQKMIIYANLSEEFGIAISKVRHYLS